MSGNELLFWRMGIMKNTIHTTVDATKTGFFHTSSRLRQGRRLISPVDNGLLIAHNVWAKFSVERNQLGEMGNEKGGGMPCAFLRVTSMRSLHVERKQDKDDCLFDAGTIGLFATSIRLWKHCL